MIYAVAFLSGAALMGLEMVGSRVLAPTFGSSIFIWGSLIGVVLAALSIGYYAGGRLADRHPRAGPLAVILGLSGLFTSLIPWASRAVLGRSAALPGAAGPLTACLVLFFVPSVLLAMVSPWCMRLSIPSVERAGHSAGLLYAVSNAGSIAGTFATSFYMIPRMGTVAILRSLSGLLLALGILVSLGAGNGNRKTLPLVLTVSMVVALSANILGGTVAEAGVIYKEQSLYHNIYVSEQGGIRLLRFDKAVQGGIYVDRPYDSAYPYPDYVHLALTLNPDIKDVLMIGLGAGLAPKRFARDYPDMNIEVVEIDPAVVRVAREYFGFPEDDVVKIHVRDGRVFLTESDKRYDLIVLDAYWADAIPFHLATIEFYETVKARLNEGGVLASNIIGALEGQRSQMFRSMYHTMARVFPMPYVFAVGYAPMTEESYRNIEVFAVASSEEQTIRLSKGDFVERARELSRSRVTVPGFEAIAQDLYEAPVSPEGAVVLTDDHAPVDALLHLY